MGDFSTAFKITSVVEGGYANDPNDNGGETYRGIARKMDPHWLGWTTIDAIKRRIGTNNPAAINRELNNNITLQTSVASYYKVNYWNVHNLDNINDQRICNELYDTGVNMGTGRAGIFVQRCLNSLSRNGRSFNKLKLDGVIGPNTVKTINSLGSSDTYTLWKLLNCLQGEKYISICEANPSQEVFMRSWASRVFENN